ncbi:hypothetical protein GPECTOR_53g120 [Gonium pectorale]|uniref:PDEase domain-containing protein n=1 Tax=Gonium pectorale TaxID=33097 RepID=A0A150G6S3_GONPE|nr:hypothetical protein GPECTOR_53g120 [Gonium pectorale]|eukprot:KXZ45534.1 hypothetical protein GPECTOR_53g120 [Gonium pectorale]
MVLATDMKQHFAILSHFNTVHRLSSYTSVPGPPPPTNRPRGAADTATHAHSGNAESESGQPASSRGGGGLIRQAGALRQFGDTAPRPLDDTERLLSLQVALKVADIGHLGEELSVHIRWLTALEEEFFSQGDRERQLGLPISPLFDRSKQGVSKSQVGFYEFVALPLAHAMASAFPGARPLLDCFVTNYDHWRRQEAKQAAAQAPPLASSATAVQPLPLGPGSSGPHSQQLLPTRAPTQSQHSLWRHQAPAAGHSRAHGSGAGAEGAELELDGRSSGMTPAERRAATVAIHLEAARQPQQPEPDGGPSASRRERLPT